MSDLANILGEDDLSDCLSELSDDVAPAQIEADAQNRAIILKRRKRMLAKKIRANPELAFSFGKAFSSIGKGLTAPLRVVGKVATGDFKGALKSAVDPMGLSKLSRKAKHTVADVRGAIKSPGAAAARLLGGAQAHAGLNFPRIPAGIRLPVPTVKMQCKPCNPNAAVSTDIAKKVVPEMQRINQLLGKMELSRKATSEHKKKKQQKAWQKEVLRLLKQIQEKRCA